MNIKERFNKLHEGRAMTNKVPYLVLFFIIFVCINIANAQQWAKTYGGSNYDYANFIQQTSDGGYIVAGYTNSFGAGGVNWWGDVCDDILVLKLDGNGNIQWQKTYGGEGGDVAYSIQQTRDGGYIVAGWTTSFGAGSSDILVLKLDGNGNIQWQKTYGGEGGDVAYSIQQTRDGGYIVAGKTTSFCGGLSPSNIWVLKLNQNGEIEWQKAYGGYTAFFIQQTQDGGYIVAGYSLVLSVKKWPSEMVVLKLKQNGDIEWKGTYGGYYYDDHASAIRQTRDGGYIVVGSTSSFDTGSAKAWVLKLDGNGNIQWQKTYGEGGFSAVQQTQDGGYIVAGGGGKLLKLDGNGNIQWQKTYGEGGFSAVQQTQDGGYIVAGWTTSFGAGAADFWVLKLDENGDITGCNIIGTSNVSVNDTDARGSIYIYTGWTGDETNAVVQNINVIITDTNASISQQCYYCTLWVTKSGTGSGTVTSNPSGISCGSDCSESYYANTPVALTAVPDSGSIFSGWALDCSSCGSNTTCEISMTSDKNCIATFTLETQTYEISGVAKDPDGSPIGGVVVRLYDEGGSLVKEVTTSGDGSFSISLTQGGFYTITFEKEGYSLLNPPQVIYLSTDQPKVSLNLIFSPSPYAFMSFKKGWNFISFPKLPPDTSLSSIFENKPVRIVWSYDNETKRWKRWRPDLSFNTLSAIEPKKGYWVYVDEPFQIETKDWVEPQDKTITLYPNWNLIGWLGEDGKSVDEALSSLGDKWIIIWGWEDGVWKARHRDSSVTLNFEPLDILNQGKAYWIKVEEEVLWAQ